MRVFDIAHLHARTHARTHSFIRDTMQKTLTELVENFLMIVFAVHNMAKRKTHSYKPGLKSRLLLLFSHLRLTVFGLFDMNQIH